jgi:hypothetical protein
MTNIELTRKYTLEEVIEKGFLPGVTGYAGLYNLVTIRVPAKGNKLGVERKLVEYTSKTKIKAEHDGCPWHKISGKITINGSELIKFLKYNSLK